MGGEFLRTKSDSARLERSHRLAERAVDLVLALVRFGSMPGLEPMLADVLGMAREAGLVIEPAR